MKYPTVPKSTKGKKLRLALLSALSASGMVFAPPAFSDGIAIYNSATDMVQVPRVHVGLDQYQVQMKKQQGEEFKYVLTEATLISMLKFKDSDNPNFSRVLLLSELAAQFSPQEVKIFDPVENREKTFRAIPTNAVLDKVYGTDWHNKEEMVAAALDGYESTISVSRFLKYNSFIAYEDVNRPQFVLVKASDAKLVELGPFWLVWDNINQPDLKAWVSYGWPYQLGSISFAKTAERFANSVPPKDSPENVRRGFEDAREFCMNCHKINGDGGSKGPELIKTGDVAKLSKEKLRPMITDINMVPVDEKTGEKVSGMVLRNEIPNRDQVADDIVAYLYAMAGK